MINMDIQELFDGSLSDERTAELLHSLSVSPERRADFRRHMALQGAMQADRVDSRLTSDEDAAIWGAITGLSAVASGAGSGFSFAWIVRGITFLAMGVVGYLLGSSQVTNIFGSGKGSQPSGTVASRNALPSVVVVPVPLPPSAASSATAASAASRVPTGSTPAGAARSFSGSSATIAAATPSLRSARNSSSSRSRNGGNARYENSVNGVDHVSASEIARAERANNAALQQQNAGANNGLSNNGAIASNGDGDVNLNNGAGTSTAPANTAPANTAPANTAPANTAPANNASSVNSDPVNTATANTAPASNANASGTAAHNAAGNAAADGATRPLSPEEVARALSDGQRETPSSAASTRALALRSDGFELAYGERLGALSNNPQTEAGTADPLFSSRHLDISYRLNNGMFGFGARFGYGSFSLLSLEPTIKTYYDDNGNINLLDTVYYPKLEAKKTPLVEFFTNYRLPIGDFFSLGAEASVGGSGKHIKAGGDLFLLWMVSERFGVQAGGGYSRYWYTSSEDDIMDLLQKGGDGASIGSSYLESVEGSIFEAKYGIFYHF